MTTITNINNGVAQAMGTNEFWNNFPVKTAYAPQTGIQGSEVTLLDMKKYAIDIDGNLRTRVMRKYPVMKIFDKVSAGATINALMHTWTDRVQNDGNSMFLPIDSLRTRDYYGSNAAVSAWGSGAATDVPNALGSINEMGGKLQFQTASASQGSVVAQDYATPLAPLNGNVDALALNLDDSTVHIGSGTKHAWSSDATKSQGIIGELKETAAVPISLDGTNKNCMVLGYSRSADDTIGRPEDFIRIMALTLGNRGYTKEEDLDLDWIVGGAASLQGSATTSTSYGYNYAFESATANSNARMAHFWWDQLYTKTGPRMEGLTNKIIGIRRFVFSNDMLRFYIIFDLEETNIDFLESVTASEITITDAGVTELTDGIYYMVTKGEISDGGAAPKYNTGEIFKKVAALDTTDATNTNSKFVPVPTAFLIEEVNTAVYSTTAASGATARHDHINRIFMPGNGVAPEGWTRMGKRLALNYNSDQQDAASADGSFNIDDLEGGYPRTEGRGKNFLQIFRSKVWGKTRLQQGTNIDGGHTFEQDRMMHLEKFYGAINWTLLMGKLTFAQNTSGNAPSTVFGYTSGAGLDGSYAGKTSGILDYSVFPIVWARMPFYAGRPGFDAKNVADAGIALVTFLEKLANSIGYKREYGSKPTYTLIVSRNVVTKLGLMYAKSASAVSDTGNIFGTEVRYNAPTEANLDFESFTYVSHDGLKLNFVIDESLDYAPKFKAPRFLLGKEYVNPRWLILMLNKQDIKVYQHASYKDQVFGNLQPNHNVNVQLEGAQASRLVELKNPEEQMIIDISPTTSI